MAFCGGGVYDLCLCLDWMTIRSKISRWERKSDWRNLSLVPESKNSVSNCSSDARKIRRSEVWEVAGSSEQPEGPEKGQKGTQKDPPPPPAAHR